MVKRKVRTQAGEVTAYWSGDDWKLSGKKKIFWRDYFDDARATSERTDPDYVNRTDRRNIDIYLALQNDSERENFLSHLPSAERRAVRARLKQIDHVLQSSPETLTEERRPDALRIELATLNKEVVDYLARHPEVLYEIAPREFEELIAGILQDMGCEIVLTPRTRDKGRDILAVFPSPFGKLLTIVECKRHRRDRPVGIDVVERFLYVLEHRDRASCGLIATTSYFSPDALKAAKELNFRLKLREFEGIREWIANYGRWIKNPSSELWVPGD